MADDAVQSKKWAWQRDMPPNERTIERGLRRLKSVGVFHCPYGDYDDSFLEYLGVGMSLDIVGEDFVM